MPEPTPVPFTIARRYTRAVHLTRDFRDLRHYLSGYHATPLALQTAARILAGLEPASTERAFSIVGPFGSGKSAFGLFLAHYLQRKPAKRPLLLRRVKAEEHAVTLLPNDTPSLLAILVAGNNSSLRRAILESLYTMLDRHLPREAASNELIFAIETATNNPAIDPQSVADLVEQAAQMLVSHQQFGGILVVIDELGQYLDFAARHDDERDLFVLQSLAEMAARSGATPCLVVTILHQAFDRYTLHAGPTRRIEWAKVQGRFLDLPFQEPASQMIRMVTHALRPPKTDPYRTARSSWADTMASAADALGVRPPDIHLDTWTDLVAQAYPLHPLVLIALPYLFRKLAQNERSLFAFLHADEPWGLRDVITSEAAPPGQLPIYRLTHLFAYVEAVLGPSLFSRARGQRWAEVAEARTVLITDDPLLLDVLTVVGIMGALERSSGLRASSAQVAFAVTDQADAATVADALLALQTRKLIAYRQHRDSYVIWEGSDLDLDALTQEARRAIGDHLSLPELLQLYAPLTPLLARRHSYRTGATRTFAVRYVDVGQIHASLPFVAGADGELLYVVPGDEEELDAALKWATASLRDAEPQRIVVIPRRVREVREVLLDVAALQSVLDERPELEHDRVARREVASRLIEAQQALSYVIAETYGGNHSRWFRRSQEVVVRSARQIDDLLSQACDETYSHTPHVWNELIVRRHLSSAAAKARRNLVEAMLEHAHDVALGLVGYPPERAIYASIVSAGGLHRMNQDGVWEIGPPPPADPLRLQPLWDAMERFLQEATTEAQPLSRLFLLMEQPPYGAKAGLIPLLFVALYVARAGEIVLYERDNYVPIPDIAVFERLLTRPEHFALRLSRAEGARLAVYEHLAHVLAPRALTQPVQPALLTVSLPLLRVLRGLPEFSKQTRRVSERAQALRTALREARAPDELLFERLPVACGLPPCGSDAPVDAQWLREFTEALRDGLQELQGAYPQLIDGLAAHIRVAFRATSSDRAHMRAELQSRYDLIADTTNDAQIRALGVRLQTADPQGDAWIESTAALIARRSPELWTDGDITAFEAGIADAGRRFRAAEDVAVATQAVPEAVPVIRIGLANGRGEVSRVVQVATQDPAVQHLQAALTKLLGDYHGLTPDQQAAALAAVLEAIITSDSSNPLLETQNSNL